MSKKISSLSLQFKLTLGGYFSLLIFVVMMFVPTTPLGGESQLGTNWALYIFGIAGLAAPILFKKANNLQPTRANTIGFWLSLLPIVILVVFVLAVLVSLRK